MKTYRQVLTNSTVRTVLLLGVLVRVPYFAVGVVLALHVVQTLGGSYAQAGLLAGVFAVCTAISGPWRGRLLDRYGLRRAVAPSVLVAVLCWSIAPFVDYLPLLVLASVAGLLEIPIFGVIRQAVVAASAEADRRSGLALESVTVEIAFMIGPVLGIAATTVCSTSYVLLGGQLGHALAGMALWVLNPPLRSGEPAVTERIDSRPEWLRGEFVALCVCAWAAVTLLAATELTFVAAMRHFGAQSWLGLALAVWGLGSVVGGLIYGAWHRPVSAPLLLLGLGAATLPMALAWNAVTLTVFSFTAGLLCAPTLTAVLDQVSRLVPEGGHGEAIGWNQTAMTAGNAAGSALAGLAIDHGGSTLSFAGAAVLGIALGGVLPLWSRKTAPGGRAMSGPNAAVDLSVDHPI